MNEEEKALKRRDWVKNAAIIFLSVMLVLTFFSNTIMNYSLPEVATQYVQSGSITAKIRGTGTVEANDPYNVIVKESRVIASVAVKQGDTVEKDQVIYYLEDADSEELTKAESELEDLELSYMKGLFGNNVSSEVISKVASGNTDTFATYQAKVKDMQDRIDAAEKRVQECQTTVNNLTLQGDKATNDKTLSTASDELAKSQAETDLSAAQTKFETEKEKTIASLNQQITALQADIKDLEALIASAESAGGTSTDSSSSGNSGGKGKSGSGSAATDATLTAQREATVKTLYGKVKAIYDAVSGSSGSITMPTLNLGYSGTEPSSTDAAAVENMKKDYTLLAQAVSSAAKDADYQTLFADYNAALMALNTIESNSKNVNDYTSNQTTLANKQAKLAQLQQKLTEVNAITYTSADSVKDAQARLDQANKNIAEINAANTQMSTALANQLLDANNSLKNAQAVLDLLKEEQTQLASDINAELDLSKTSRDIQKKQEEIEKLRENSEGAAIKAPVAGTISSLAHVAGETMQANETVAVIEAEGKGYTVSFTVTNDQAKKVQVGDVAELQNAWYYDDAMATLSAIKPDAESGGQKKKLEFTVTGSSIQAGQSLSLSVGQRSAEYDLVVPNSAIREDNNGKFILIVESKSGPISNRYIATRVDVEVLASDDNNSAISAGLYGYEYVITTSTKPVEAGKQVRLSTNS